MLKSPASHISVTCQRLAVRVHFWLASPCFYRFSLEGDQLISAEPFPRSGKHTQRTSRRVTGADVMSMPALLTGASGHETWKTRSRDEAISLHYQRRPVYRDLLSSGGKTCLEYSAKTVIHQKLTFVSPSSRVDCLLDLPEMAITLSSAHDNDALIHGLLTVYRQAYKVLLPITKSQS